MSQTSLFRQAFRKFVQINYRFYATSNTEDLKVNYLTDNQQGIVVLALNRPEAKNSFR